MRYALNLADDGRIESVTYEEYAAEGSIIVDDIPEGNTRLYRYVDGEYVYDPIPTEEQHEAEPTADDVLNTLLGVTV